MPKRFRWRLAPFPLLAMLMLAGCHHEGADAPTAVVPGGASPAAAMQTTVQLIRKRDFAGFWRHALPPTDYDHLRADWQHHEAGTATLSDQDRATFSETMRKLTAPDAKASMNAQLQPRLAQAEQKYGDQLPLLVGIGHALVLKSVSANARLDQAQKHDISAVVDAIAPWAQKVSWFDPARAQQAIGVAVDTARALNLQSAEQLRALAFEPAMHAYGVTFDGLCKALAVYGLSIDAALDSVKVVPLSVNGDTATVRLDYTLLGKPLSATAQMQRVDQRWYATAVVDAARDRHRRAGRPAAAASAPARAATSAVADAKP